MDFSVNYPFEWKLKPALLERNLRFFIFIIIVASAGLPALVWSVGELIDYRRNGQRISVFIILLLLTDFADLFLSPYILIKHLLNEFCWNMDWTCCFFLSLWWSSRACGLLLNQLVALEGILSVRYPLYTAAVFSSVWFRIFYSIVFLCISMCEMFLFDLIIRDRFGQIYPVFFCLVSLITWMISCGASCSAERHSHTSRKADQHIWVIFILTLLVFYLPFILLLFFDFHFSPHYIIIHLLLIAQFLMSVRLMSDPLLCVLVCRQSLQSSQNPEETVVQSEEIL